MMFLASWRILLCREANGIIHVDCMLALCRDAVIVTALRRFMMRQDCCPVEWPWLQSPGGDLWLSSPQYYCNCPSDGFPISPPDTFLPWLLTYTCYGFQKPVFVFSKDCIASTSRGLGLTTSLTLFCWKSELGRGWVWFV